MPQNDTTPCPPEDLTHRKASPLDTLREECFSDRAEDLHYLRILDTGWEAFLARIHLLREAKRSICIQTFIWRDDRAGNAVLHELVQAARRGVQVRVLLDQWVQTVSPERATKIEVFLHTPNMELRFYNPSIKEYRPHRMDLLFSALKNIRQANQRMHNKLLLVDDEMGITGGRNYENAYFDLSASRNFRDLDVLLIGREAKAMKRSFEEYWEFKWTIPAEDMNDTHQRPTSSPQFDLGPLAEKLESDLRNGDYLEKKLYRTREVRYLADKPWKNRASGLKGGSLTAYELEMLIGSAEKQILIQSPYLVFDDTLFDAAKRMRTFKPELDIRISTNSLASTDNLYAYAASQLQRKTFLEDLRYRIFEAKPVPASFEHVLPHWRKLSQESEKHEEELGKFEKKSTHLTIHAKVFLIDSYCCWVGSFNLDPRSVHLNTESGLIVRDRAFASAVQKKLELDMEAGNSWAVGLAKKPAVRTYFSAFWARLIRYLPRISIWPYVSAECFELKDGQQECSCFSDSFYDSYTSVGRYPEVDQEVDEIELGLVKALAGALRGLI